jgi:putative ABC transport system permease protein
MSALTLKALRDIVAHRGQFLALVVLVAIGITSYVTFQNSARDLQQSLDTAYTTLRLADFNVVALHVPRTAAREIERLPGVAAARVRVVRDVGLDLAEREQASARLITVSVDHPATVNALQLMSGRLPAPAATDEVVLDPKFSGETGIGVGDSLTVRLGGQRKRVRVVGVGSDPEYLYPRRSEGDIPTPGEFAVVWLSDHAAEYLLGGRGGTEVCVRLAPGARATPVIEAVERELRAYEVVETVRREDMPGYAGLKSEVDQNQVMARTMPPLVLAISAMSLFIALSRIVQSQRGQIGLAKALGYTDAAILGHYLSFGVIIAIAGSALGSLLGLLGARGMAATYVGMLGIPFLESRIYPDIVALGAGLALLTCAAAAIVPAWTSARLAPAIAMHPDPNRALSGGRVPILERVLDPLIPRALVFRLPLRNVFRARRRSLYTVLGIAFAMILTVTTVAMFDSIDFLVAETFGRAERWDISAVFGEPFGSARIEEVRGYPGVSSVQPALVVPVTVAANGREKSIVLTAMSPSATFHGFKGVGASDPAKALAADEIVLSESVAKALRIPIGARISVDSPVIDEPVALTVGALSSETLGQPAFASFDAAGALLGRRVTEYNALYITARPTESETIRDRIYDLPGASSVIVKAGLIKRLKKLLEMFNTFGAVLLGFGMSMAFVVIYTTFSTNVNERTREIATMRTIGESNWRLAVIITAENLLIAVAALPLGIWLGLQAADAAFARFASDSYTLTATVFPVSIARICLAMIGVLLISEIAPIRRIFRLDLAEATKVME